MRYGMFLDIIPGIRGEQIARSELLKKEVI